MDPIEFKNTVTEADYRATVYFNVFNKRKWFKPLIMSVVIISVISIILRLNSVGDIENSLFYPSVLFLAFLALLFIAIEVNIVRYVKTDKIVIGSERNVAIDEDGIFTSGGKENSTAKYKWDTIYKAYEIKNHFLIYINFQQAIIIPKMQLTPQQEEQIREILEQKLDSNFYFYS